MLSSSIRNWSRKVDGRNGNQSYFGASANISVKLRWLQIQETQGSYPVLHSSEFDRDNHLQGQNARIQWRDSQKEAKKSQDYNLSCKSNSTETTIRYRYLLILFIILAKIKGHYLMGIGGLQAMITDSRLLPRLLACTTREISLTKCPTTKWIFFIPMEIVCVFPSYSFNGLGNCTLRSPSS